MQLRMSTRQVDGVLVVDCSGRVVFGEESATLRDTVKKLLAQSPKVVLNLREVNYIDSGERASESWKSDQVAMIAQMKTPKADVLLAVASAVQTLIEASAATP